MPSHCDERHEIAEIALVFLQNCCKGTPEANYAFRDATPFTLSSQTVLVAPNYYYGGALKCLQDNPGTDGAGLGEAIIDHEQAHMFSGHCLVQTRRRERPQRCWMKQLLLFYPIRSTRLILHRSPSTHMAQPGVTNNWPI